MLGISHALKSAASPAYRWLKAAVHSRDDLVRRLKLNPRDVGTWVSLIDKERRAGRLPEPANQLARAHQIEPSRVVGSYYDQIAQLAGPSLDRSAEDPLPAVPAVLDEIIRWKTILQCRDNHGADFGYYYSEAEHVMTGQWAGIIWPIIKEVDFTTVLELAPGHGRNTDLLRRHAKTIHLVDVNETCLQACRARFGDERAGCRFFYHLTDGNHFRMVADHSITFGYSWDSMVHFDKLVVRDYLAEFARVLVGSGSAFLHHSNLGAFRPNSDWASNHGGRSDLSAALFNDYADAVGLTVSFQRLSGTADGWGIDGVDCLSVVRPAMVAP